MKIQVQKIEEVHLPVRVKWMQDERVHNQMPVPFPVSLAETKAWLSNIKTISNTRIDFSFLNHQSGEILAFAGLGKINQVDKNADLYIIVDPELSGNGIGSACLKWLLNYGFIILGLNKIYCYTIAANDGANNFYKKLGFKKEGTLRNQMFFRGSFVNRNFFGLLREEWIIEDWAAKEFPGFIFEF